MLCIDKIEENIKKNLSLFRYQHTMRVAKEAKALAKYYQLEEEKAYIAGLLHDIAKEFSEEENKRLIEKYKLPQELKNKQFKNIIHADIGAEFAREYYDIDIEIYKAIKYHTIGNRNMSMLAKIIFVADKIARENLSIKMQEVKKTAYVKIEEAIRLIILLEEEKLNEKGLRLHPDTVALLNEIKDK